MEYTGAAPIFIIGRQHSGNTMLASVFEKARGMRSMRGEGTFFEYQTALDRLAVPGRIAAVAQSIKDSDQPPLEHALLTGLCDHLKRVSAESLAEPSAAQLYSHGMDWLVRQAGAERWSQKATSYIFYVPDVLRVFPRAKLIFLLRNPFDLMASAMRRAAAHDRAALELVRLALGWNKGVKLAGHYRVRYPGNFMQVRYEDLAARPESTLREIFNFAGLAFDPAYLDIHHVNRSETPYNLTSEQRGINGSRVYYYAQTLSPAQIGALTAVISMPGLRRSYPELGSLMRRSRPSWRSVIPLYANYIWPTINQQAGLLIRKPRYALARTW